MPKTLVIIFFTLTTFSPLLAQTLGDANNSGTIDIIDALVTARYCAGLAPQPFYTQAADVNGSKAVEITDALLIAQYAAGLIKSFPAATPAPSPTLTPTPTSNMTGKKIVGYFTSWSIYQREFFPDKLPYQKLTHINYAFANIVNGEIALGDSYADIDKQYDGDTWDQPLRGNFYQLNVKYRNLYPHLKTLISVGGWTWSGGFSDVALTDASRKKFAASCVAFIKKYYFDGVDIDWEYPDGGGLDGTVSRPEDLHNYTLLMAELRAQLTAQGNADGKSYYLTAAASAGTNHIANLELSPLMNYLDWINIMTYDFHGAWDQVTGHLANLYPTTLAPDASGISCDTAVNAYLARGVAKEKLVLGVPFYGRAWGGVPATRNGLGQTATTPVTGSWGEAGYFDYADISSKGYPAFWDNSAQAPWSYSSQEQVFISYDNPQSLGLKGDYVNAKGLGGIMIWELSGDRTFALLDTINSKLRP